MTLLINSAGYVDLWEREVSERGCIFQIDRRPFRTVDEIERHRDQLIEFLTKGKEYYDSLKAKLCYFQADNNQPRFIFSLVKYSDYIITNNAMEVILPDGRTIRQVTEPGPNLKPLNESLCSNHLGVSCIVITSDKKIILHTASKRKITGAGQVTASASGAMDWKIPFVDPFEVTRAELYQELGLLPEETAGIVLVGVGREPSRGGKPEAFFILRSSLSSTDILSRTIMDSDKEIDQRFAIDIPTSYELAEHEINQLYPQYRISQSAQGALYYCLRNL